MWAVVALGILTAIVAWIWFGGGEKKTTDDGDTSVTEKHEQEAAQDDIVSSELKDPEPRHSRVTPQLTSAVARPTARQREPCNSLQKVCGSLPDTEVFLKGRAGDQLHVSDKVIDEQLVLQVTTPLTDASPREVGYHTNVPQEEETMIRDVHTSDVLQKERTSVKDVYPTYVPREDEASVTAGCPSDVPREDEAPVEYVHFSYVSENQDKHQIVQEVCFSYVPKKAENPGVREVCPSLIPENQEEQPVAKEVYLWHVPKKENQPIVKEVCLSDVQEKVNVQSTAEIEQNEGIVQMNGFETFKVFQEKETIKGCLFEKSMDLISNDHGLHVSKAQKEVEKTEQDLFADLNQSVCLKEVYVCQNHITLVKTNVVKSEPFELLKSDLAFGKDLSSNADAAGETETDLHSTLMGDLVGIKSMNGEFDHPKSKRVVAVQPLPQHVQLSFKVHYITHSDSQIIAVTGNHNELGMWEVYVPLTSGKDGLWSNSVSIPADIDVEWKFVMVENGKIQRWEECNNRCLKTTHDLEAQQWWGYP